MRYPTRAVRRQQRVEVETIDRRDCHLGSFLTRPLTSCVTISKSPFRSVPQFLHLLYGGNNCSNLIKLIWFLRSPNFLLTLIIKSNHNSKQNTSPLNIVHLWGKKIKELDWKSGGVLLVYLVSISWFPPGHHPSPTLSPVIWAGLCSGVLATTSTSSACDRAISSKLRVQCASWWQLELSHGDSIYTTDLGEAYK